MGFQGPRESNGRRCIHSKNHAHAGDGVRFYFGYRSRHSGGNQTHKGVRCARSHSVFVDNTPSADTWIRTKARLIRMQEESTPDACVCAIKSQWLLLGASCPHFTVWKKGYRQPPMNRIRVLPDKDKKPERRFEQLRERGSAAVLQGLRRWDQQHYRYMIHSVLKAMS
ncbi:hypothetical protein EDB86DRAFT_1142034 [Lactarius hatsudake]|nr:hypothetical protein EDB86DRAFT_1142034 [Lactarius hatsudake]